MTRQCEVILAQFTSPGYAIDIGANDGLFLSNTIDMEQQGWRVLCIEANGYYGPDLWANRKEVVIGAVGDVADDREFYLRSSAYNKYASLSGLTPIEDSSCIPVQVNTLDWYLQVWQPPRLDVLCIDTEGGEAGVLRGFDLARWHPKVICLEDWTRNNAFGSYLANYSLVETVDFDHIYVAK